MFSQFRCELVQKGLPGKYSAENSFLHFNSNLSCELNISVNSADNMFSSLRRELVQKGLPGGGL